MVQRVFQESHFWPSIKGTENKREPGDEFEPVPLFELPTFSCSRFHQNTPGIFPHLPVSGSSRQNGHAFWYPDPGPLATESSDQIIRFNSFRFLSAKLVQFHLSKLKKNTENSIQMVSAQAFYSDKTGTHVRFTGFFKSQSSTPFLRRFTGFLQPRGRGPFFDLQGFYRVKSGPLSRFTEFLHSQPRPPFSIYSVFTGSDQFPIFDLQGFSSVKRVLLVSDCKSFFTCYLHYHVSNIYRLFTKKIL